MKGKSYYVSKTRKPKEIMYLELEKLDGYKISPKIKEKDAIGVSKIIFVNDEMTERIIRKKIDRKIEQLLKQLKLVEEDGDNSEGTIKKTLMDAEKLRVQLLEKYVKYLGNTYHSLTLKKIQLIIEELRYKLYLIEFKKQEIYENIYEEPKKEGKRGR